MPSFELKDLFVLGDAKSFLAYFSALLASIAFSIAFTYIHRIYHGGSGVSQGIERSFLLISPSVTAIFLIIQFSLPLSLGLLGALSFVRFRTPVKEPEEIGFILLVIGSALCCAVFRFEVAFALTLVGASVALLKNSGGWPGRWLQTRVPMEMFVTSKKAKIDRPFVLNQVMGVLKDFSFSSDVLSISDTEEQISFHLRLKSNKKGTTNVMEELSRKVEGLPAVSNVNLIVNAA